MKKGTPVFHPLSGLTDKIDDSVVHPDGELIVRLEAADKWFYAKDCLVED